MVSKLAHLVDAVDDLGLVLVLVHHFDSGDVAAVQRVLLKLYLVFDEKVHEPFLLL